MEKSCGIIIFRLAGGVREYLILHYEEGHWDLPKGHVEAGESEIETAIREAREETGITDIRPIPGFRERLEYRYLRDGRQMEKEVIFFLGRTGTAEVRLSEEHTGYEWLDYRKAMLRLTYENARGILEKADRTAGD
ncbi:MAG: bis(5'-nucleosyl)-tetraphosphatase [Candidatus Micrarchaeia archaeon]